MAIISVDDVKAHLDLADSRDDVPLKVATAAANQWVVEYCGRSFDKTATGSATARTFRAEQGCWMWTDDFWETTVLQVKVDQDADGTFEETWTLNTDFYLEPLNGLLHGQARPYYKIVSLAGRMLPYWTGRPAVQVTAAWGWTAVPDAVKHATLLQAAKLFSRKDSPVGVVGGAVDFTAIRVSNRVDPDVADELGPFRHPKIAAPQVA